MIKFIPKVDVYRRYPDQFLQTLAKIGGMIGLLKILSFFLHWHHRRIFEASYQTKRKIEVDPLNYSVISTSGIECEDVPFRDKFSYDQILALVQRVKDLEARFQRQERKLERLESRGDEESSRKDK